MNLWITCATVVLVSSLTVLDKKCQLHHEEKNKTTSRRNNFDNEMKHNHQGIGLSDPDLIQIASLNDTGYFQSVLDPILVVRVPGTEGHDRVCKHIISAMKSLGWTTEEDSFTDSTPHGPKPFTNIIATLDPDAPRRLVLACHYDSLVWDQDGMFIGASDAAVSCAMMINLAKTLQGSLEKHKLQQNNLTLQFLFFDGEEAFVEWSDTDSLYGSRHLANKLHKTPYSEAKQEGINQLHRMDMFVLLDLIGTEDCQFISFFPSTERWYQRLVSLEQRLGGLNMLSTRMTLFQNQTVYGAIIGDDHVPFLKRGYFFKRADILHLISVPFPSVWHKISDNADALHYPTIQNMNTILRAFVADYLHLSI